MPFSLQNLAWRVWYAYQVGQARLSLSLRSPRTIPSPPQRFLLVCTGLVGDSVMTTPFLRQFRANFPAARIGMLGRPAQLELFGPLGLIDEFFLHPTGLPLPTSWKKLEAWQRIYAQVRAFHPEVGIVLLGGEWLPLLARLRLPVRIDSERSRFPGLCTHRYPFPNVRYLSPETYLGILPLLGVEPDYKEIPALRVDSPALAHMRERLQAQGIQRYWVLNPFAATANRTFSQKKLQQIIEAMHFPDREILLVGPPGAQLDASFLSGKPVHNWIGQTSLAELMALIQLSEGVVTVDTGVLHIAGALRKPTVGLFRAIRPEYAHLYPTVTPIFWEKGPECLPGCKWDSWYGCSEVPCRQLEGIAPLAVRQAVEKILSP